MRAVSEFVMNLTMKVNTLQGVLALSVCMTGKL